MKKILTATVASMALIAGSAWANDADQRIMFELGFGFGDSAAVTDKNPNSKWCKHRNRGGMKFGAIRYQYDDVEVHFARWTGDNGGADVCDRDMNAVGVGYVLSTQKDGEDNRDDAYATWTPGVSYAWSTRNRMFTGKDEDNTNWRQTGNFQVFNRVAVGVNSDDFFGEVAVHRYGTWNPDHGETFLSVGVGLQDLEDPSNSSGDGDREVTPPDSGDVTINNNDITINITENVGDTEDTGQQTQNQTGVADGQIGGGGF